MTAFTFNTSITATKRGLGSFKYEAVGGTGSPSLPAGSGRVSVNLNNKVVNYAVSHTNDSGAASGTIIAADTVLATGVTGTSTSSVGLTAIGFDASSNRYNFVAALKAQLEIDFATEITSVTFPGSATSGTDTATFNVSNAEVLEVSENLSNVSGAILTTPSRTEKDIFSKHSGWIGKLDDDVNNAARLQAIMGTADANASGGYDIASNTEFDGKFVPGIHTYIKRKK